jgi:predicted nucleic acid-binding protein
VNDTWVTNASPIITLAKADQLHLLVDLCKNLFVPQAVVAEVLAGPPSDGARRALERGWGSVVAPECIAPELLEWRLGAGETAVLAVAMEQRPATAVLDDAAARSCARSLGIEVIGTLGVVLRAKKQGLIPLATTTLKQLCAAGLRLDDEMVRSALHGIGEVWP